MMVMYEAIYEEAAKNPLNNAFDKRQNGRMGHLQQDSLTLDFLDETEKMQYSPVQAA